VGNYTCSLKVFFFFFFFYHFNSYKIVLDMPILIQAFLSVVAHGPIFQLYVHTC
jgi:hypothetical protein